MTEVLSLQQFFTVTFENMCSTTARQKHFKLFTSYLLTIPDSTFTLESVLFCSVSATSSLFLPVSQSFMLLLLQLTSAVGDGSLGIVSLVRGELSFNVIDELVTTLDFRLSTTGYTRCRFNLDILNFQRPDFPDVEPSLSQHPDIAYQGVLSFPSTICWELSWDWLLLIPLL